VRRRLTIDNSIPPSIDRAKRVQSLGFLLLPGPGFAVRGGECLKFRTSPYERPPPPKHPQFRPSPYPHRGLFLPLKDVLPKWPLDRQVLLTRGATVGLGFADPLFEFFSASYRSSQLCSSFPRALPPPFQRAAPLCSNQFLSLLPPPFLSPMLAIRCAPIVRLSEVQKQSPFFLFLSRSPPLSQLSPIGPPFFAYKLTRRPDEQLPILLSPEFKLSKVEHSPPPPPP